MLLQMLGLGRCQIFVGRDQSQHTTSDYDLVKWARAHGYQSNLPEHSFAIYENGVRVREWFLLDRPDDTSH